MPVLAILSMLAGAAASLLMLLLLLAGSPNSSDAQLRQIKLLMLSVAMVAAAGFLGGLWAFAKTRYGLSATLGAAPLAFCVALFIWLLVTQR